ncbi:hypothetical protein BDZ89DRAFT_1177990 [Hymenopellis radicata]|nr:hypothetical protein BDZ89DRAFT_1177990 [Hymenopellis radicata]
MSQKSASCVTDADVWDTLRYMKTPPVRAADELDILQSEVDISDQRIAALQTIFHLVITNEKRRREELFTQLERRRGMYAPVRALPRDILIRIFHLATTVALNVDFGVPRVLCQVCFYWRDVVMSTSALWSAVYLRVPVRERDVPKLEVFLERSRGHPLDLQLLGRSREIPLCLRKQSRRIRFLQVSGAFLYRVLGSFMEKGRCEIRLPLLKNVVLTPDYCPEPAFQFDLPQGSKQPILDAPLLTRMDLYFTRVGYIMQMPPSLTHYEAEVQIASDFDVLVDCPKLLHVCLFREDREGPLQGPTHRIHNLSIQRITVTSDDFEILNFLLLPNLKELEIRTVSKIDDINCISSFIDASQCTIDRVASLSFDSEAAAYCSFLDLGRTWLSSVTKLAVVDLDDDNSNYMEFYAQLSHTPDRAAAFPRLTILSVDVEDLFYGKDQSISLGIMIEQGLKAMLQSRDHFSSTSQCDSPRLEELHLPGLPKEQLATLPQLLEIDSLQFSISYPEWLCP